MSGFSMYLEPGVDGAWSIKILDGEGNLYRYFASVSTNYELLHKMKEYFDAGDISPMHIDDIICDILCI